LRSPDFGIVAGLAIHVLCFSTVHEHFMRVPYRDPGSFMLRLSVTFVHPGTLVSVEKRTFFGYYIGESGKKSGTFIRAIGALV